MTAFANKIDMQHRLFSELSRMFGKEVPLYDKALLVNLVCNRAVCDLLGKLHTGFEISDEQIDRTSGERHGAIRIGTPTEYRRVAQFFAAFAMEPHNFYDMTNVGSKSQPIIATAFRSTLNPEHRVFCSLLQTNYFDPGTQGRIDALLATREVFSKRAIELIEKNQRDGGLSAADADALIREGVERIFKWTGKARDHKLYKDLSDGGFKIAADIACFESHHLNHLTPNTFCMDLYTAAMKHAMGEMDEATFASRATTTLNRLTTQADGHFMRLHFRHLTGEQIERFGKGHADGTDIAGLVSRLIARLHQPDLNLAALKHSGFKEFTEGPAQDTPVLLRQDAYKALTEPVEFHNADGSVVNTVHTARFGEIEERFYATTLAGRELYDTCLAAADAARDRDPGLPKRDFAAYEAAYAAPFAPFPKTLDALVAKGFVYAKYEATPKGIAAAGTLKTTDIGELVQAGYARLEGVRYEDFLPVSAAGIFASNLNQYGTKSTAAVKPVYTQAMLEEIMGRPIIVADKVYHAIEAASLHATFEKLGLVARLTPHERAGVEAGAALLHAVSAH
ncbi:MAG: DUF1338 family protein [Phycisphaerales bacterium]|jgi:uncharacterized glyoxalase superfamily metalloenzyme YdcJ